MRPMLREGDIVGPYRVGELVGQGGLGLVYRALDPRLERMVALKVIALVATPPQDKGDFGARLLREARASAALNHPNIVSVYDVGEHTGVLYLAMEFVEGRTLRAAVGDPGIPLGERLRWLVDVARGLSAAHRAGLVHRDVKPETVMVRGDGVVKVLDFGIARRTSSGREGNELVTGDEQVTGTPVYMAPEQLRGDPVDSRIDQFAWGVLAYELLSGERPWKTTAEGYALVAAILTDIPPPLHERVPGLPGPVAEVVHRALAKHRDERFPSMDDVAAELEPYAQVGSPRPSSARAIIAPRGHEPEAFAETTRVPTTLDQPAQEPSPPARPSRRRKWFALGSAVTALVLGAGFLAFRRPGPAIHKAPAACSVSEAQSAYAAALIHLRDGAASEAELELRRATEQDPSCAAAHLELALHAFDRDPQEGLRHFQAAFHGRQSLNARQLALLEASEPFVRPKPDLVEWETRLTAAVYRFQEDAPLRVWLGRARERQLDLEGAKKAFETATRIDVGFAPAWAGLADVQKRLGDRTAALSDIETCLERSPVASVCVGARYALHAESGECTRAKEDASTWVALDPTSTEAARGLGASLFSLSAPRPGVEEALRRRRELLPPQERAEAELGDRLVLALADGAFTESLELTQRLEGALPANADTTEHAAVAMQKVSIFSEVGSGEAAAKAAKNYLDRVLAYPPNALVPDPSIAFVEPLFRAGQLTRSELEARRIAWQNAEIARTRATDPSVLAQQRRRLAWLRWALVHASFAETKEEAQAALQQVPQEQEPPPGQRSLRFDFAVGKVLALAGQHAHALDHLERVTGACLGLWEPQVHIRAHYYLGLALEGRGEMEAAARAYRVVLERWGKARPPSLTAQRAARRLAALPIKEER